MADFYRPAPGLELDDLAERVAARVVDMYSSIEAELIYEIARRVLRGLPRNPTFDDQLAVIRQLQATARNLLATIPPDLAAQIVAIAAERGTAAATAAMRLTDEVPHFSDVTRTAADTLSLIAVDLGNAFDQVHLRILRYPIDAVGNFIGTDVYQQTVARFAGLRTVGNLTTDEVRRRTLASFLEQGVTGFTDRLGRKWRIGSYTEMAVRTATARAFHEAGDARMARSGTRFISVVGNNDACALCATWFGKVLSIDGTPAGTYQVEHPYLDGVMVTVEVAATLDDARAAGLHHPNCACRHAAHYPGLSVATSAAHYDPVAEAGRERQRLLERRKRALKRRLAAADATGDTSRVDATKARIRKIDAELRELTARTGQKRRYDREQARWADGPSGRTPEPPIVPTVAGPPSQALAAAQNRARIRFEEAADGS